MGAGLAGGEAVNIDPEINDLSEGALLKEQERLEGLLKKKEMNSKEADRLAMVRHVLRKIHSLRREMP